jgi:hypothetical protein
MLFILKYQKRGYGLALAQTSIRTHIETDVQNTLAHVATLECSLSRRGKSIEIRLCGSLVVVIVRLRRQNALVGESLEGVRLWSRIDSELALANELSNQLWLSVTCAPLYNCRDVKEAGIEESPSIRSCGLVVHIIFVITLE